MLNSDVFFMFCLLARGYTARESGYIRGKLIGIHRDWMKLLNSDVFCFGNFWRYIGKGLYWPIPMYFLLGIGPSYIGMGIEILIPMYRLLKLGSPYIGMALNRASPMYVPKIIHSGYIGMLQEHQIPMYPKKEYIGTPQKQAIPMYPSLKNTPSLSKSINFSNPRPYIPL